MRRLNCLTIMTLAMFVFLLPQSSVLAAEANRERIVLQLKWNHLYQFAGYYAALEKGYYRESGLEVSFLEAGPGIDPVQIVLDGKAQFGVSTSELLLHRLQGKKVTVLAAIFQHSPLAIMSLKAGPVQTVHDLQGKRVMFEPGSSELLAYLRKEFIPQNQLFILPHTHRWEDLIENKADAMTIYVTDEPYFVRKAGQEVNLFSARSAGIDFYGDCLFSTEEYVAKRPEVVRKFRQASLRGWIYAMQNQDEMVELIRKRYLPEQSRDKLVFEAEQIKQLIRADLVEIGYMNPGRWQHIAETFAGLGMIQSEVVLGGFIYSPQANADNELSPVILYGVGGLGLVALLTTVFLLRYVALSRRLRRSKALHQSIWNASPDEIAITDLTGKIQMVSPAALTIFRCENESQLVGRNLGDFIAAEDKERVLADLGKMMQEKVLGRGEYRGLRGDGTHFDFDVNGDLIRDASGKVQQMVFIIRDVTERNLTQKALQESERKYRLLFENSIESIVVLQDGRVKFCNSMAFQLTGYSREELLDAQMGRFIHPEDRIQVQEKYQRRIKGEAVENRHQFRLLCKDGSVRVVETSGVTIEWDGKVSTLNFMEDITQRKRLEDELQRQAKTDDLTGLFNRRYFVERAEAELARQQRYGGNCSLLMLDIDHFKNVNDSYGHAVGDVALQRISMLCMKMRRESDLVGRVGGEEFAILLIETDCRTSLQVAERLRQVIEEDEFYTDQGDRIVLTVSIGVSERQDQTQSFASLMVQADKALYEAKRNGRNKVVALN